MSDIADRAIWRIEKDVHDTMAHVRKQPMLESDGRCHFCDEPIQHALLFCSADCQDDYNKDLTALKRAGRRQLSQKAWRQILLAPGAAMARPVEALISRE